MPEEEERFEFVDKRRTTGGSPEAESKEDDRTASSAAETPPGSDESGEHPRLAAVDRLLMCLDILQQGAWISLGLVLDPVTQKIERNLGEAKQLIDACAAIAEIVEPSVEEPFRRDLRNMVANLRLNFVNQARRGES